MRVALLITVLLGCAIGCDRQRLATVAKPHVATSQPAEWGPPAGSLDAVFAEIVRIDDQTAGRWEPRSSKPPLNFLSRVREEAEFRRVDLNGDGLDERIICLNYVPGQKPINQTFWVVARMENGWAIIGEIEGDPKVVTEAPRSEAGMMALDATWYEGGFVYRTTRYAFRGGHYAAGASTRWQPTGN